MQVTRVYALGFLSLVALAGCAAKRPSAAEACAALEKSGEARGCTASAPGGLGAAATAKSETTLVSVPGKTCQVLQFGSEDAFDTASKAFEAAAMLAGPHRYGNRAKLIFVQCNSDLAADKGAKIKAAVDAL